MNFAVENKIDIFYNRSINKKKFGITVLINIRDHHFLQQLRALGNTRRKLELNQLIYLRREAELLKGHLKVFLMKFLKNMPMF